MDVIIGLVIIGISLWISLKFLKFIFIQAKSFFGWIGPYIVAAVPAAGVYLITTSLFGVGIANASIIGFLTAAIIGMVLGGA